MANIWSFKLVGAKELVEVSQIIDQHLDVSKSSMLCISVSTEVTSQEVAIANDLNDC